MKEKYKEKYSGCNLIAKNLPKTLTEKELRELFKPYGDVTSVKISTQGVLKTIMKNDVIVDKEFIYESKGYGYICFKNGDQANEVLLMIYTRLLAN
jgi:RNA recognition motif-containing protein